MTDELDARPLGKAKFLSRYEVRRIAGKRHWCEKRTQTAMCDKVKKGGVLAPGKGDEVCPECTELAKAKVRLYTKAEARKFQGALL